MWDLVPRPGIEPGPPALAAQSLNHWTAREVPNVPQISIPTPGLSLKFQPTIRLSFEQIPELY